MYFIYAAGTYGTFKASVPDVINDVFFTLRKIPFAFNSPAWSPPNLSSSCLSPPFHLPYFSSPWETWERPSPPSLLPPQYHHFPHQVPHNLFHHHAHTLTLGSKLILKLTSALVPGESVYNFSGNKRTAICQLARQWPENFELKKNKNSIFA